MEMKLVPYTVQSILTKEVTSYGIEQLEVDEIWKQGEKGKGVVVAVLDTGIDRNHPDLKGNIIGGRNFTNEGTPNQFQDLNGHGTHVAGIVLNVAPESTLLIGKVLDEQGRGNYDSIIKAIEWVSEWVGLNGERVRVINMSLGGSQDDPRLYEAILQAVSKGILVVTASGNEGDGNPDTFEHSYPSLYNECITVGACDQYSKLARFSNEHLQVDFIASGVDIPSTYLNGGFAVLSGTSMATPHISGCIALIINVGERQFRRMLTESEIYSLLVKCSCSLGYQKSGEGNGIPKLSQLQKHC